MSRQYHENASNSEQRERVTWLIEKKTVFTTIMAFLSYTILYYHCRLLNVKARAYDTGFGNPSNISSTK
jgi:uncharacterized membrane protein